jgi:hypothetical protein
MTGPSLLAASGMMLSDSQDLIFSAPYQKMVKEMEVI